MRPARAPPAGARPSPTPRLADPGRPRYPSCTASSPGPPGYGRGPVMVTSARITARRRGDRLDWVTTPRPCWTVPSSPTSPPCETQWLGRSTVPASQRTAPDRQTCWVRSLSNGRFVSTMFKMVARRRAIKLSSCRIPMPGTGMRVGRRTWPVARMAACFAGCILAEAESHAHSSPT